MSKRARIAMNAFGGALCIVLIMTYLVFPYPHKQLQGLIYSVQFPKHELFCNEEPQNLYCLNNPKLVVFGFDTWNYEVSVENVTTPEDFSIEVPWLNIHGYRVEANEGKLYLIRPNGLTHLGQVRGNIIYQLGGLYGPVRFLVQDTGKTGVYTFLLPLPE